LPDRSAHRGLIGTRGRRMPREVDACVRDPRRRDSEPHDRPTHAAILVSIDRVVTHVLAAAPRHIYAG
jgi:hypothetical protein